MSVEHCHHEDAVRRAVADDAWTTELERHVAGCRRCADLVLVQEVLQRGAHLLQPDTPLPDPTAIWWRARLHQRAEAAERATWIIPALQRLALACGAVVAGVAVAHWWRVISSWLGALIPDSLVAAGAASPTLVIVGSLGVLALLVLFDFTHVRQ